MPPGKSYENSISICRTKVQYIHQNLMNEQIRVLFYNEQSDVI